MNLNYKYPAGHFTMDDRVGDIYQNPKGKQLLEVYFGQTIQDKRFEMMKKMPIGATVKYAGQMFTLEQCNQLSDDLNKIKKWGDMQ